MCGARGVMGWIAELCSQFASAKKATSVEACPDRESSQAVLSRLDTGMGVQRVASEQSVVVVNHMQTADATASTSIHPPFSCSWQPFHINAATGRDCTGPISKLTIRWTAGVHPPSELAE
jgi:hypothetical protein